MEEVKKQAEIKTPEEIKANDTSASPKNQSIMPASEKKIIVYFAEWAIYARNHQVSDLPASQITHINYAFAQLNHEGDVSIYDSWAAIEKPFGKDTWESPLKGTYHALQVLKS